MSPYQFILQFLEESAATIRTEASRRSYRENLWRLSQWAGRPFSELTERDLIEFCLHGDPAPGTVCQRRSVLRTFYRWAHRRGLVKQNPAEHLGEAVRVRRKVIKQRHWLTPAQVREAIESCPDNLHGARDRAVLATLAYTGLRRAELANLRWEHVDLDSGVITVYGKGEKPSLVGISDELRHELKAWQEHHSSGPLFCGLRFSQKKGGYYLLHDRPFGVSGILDVVKAAGRRIGVPGLAPHDLRRSLAGILESRDVPIDVISAVLRHESIATTQRYLESNPRKGVAALQNFSL